MEVVKVINESYRNRNDLKNVIFYVTDWRKTKGNIGAYGTDADHPVDMVNQMWIVKQQYGKLDGYRQLRHIVVSFEEEWQVTPELALQIAYEIAAYYATRYQICFGVHLDQENIHIHFVMNSVSYMDGKLYSDAGEDLNRFKQYVNCILQKYIPKEALRAKREFWDELYND